MLLLGSVVFVEELLEKVLCRDGGDGAHNYQVRDGDGSFVGAARVVGFRTEQTDELAALPWDETKGEADEDDDEDPGLRGAEWVVITHGGDAGHNEVNEVVEFEVVDGVGLELRVEMQCSSCGEDECGDG